MGYCMAHACRDPPVTLSYVCTYENVQGRCIGQAKCSTFLLRANLNWRTDPIDHHTQESMEANSRAGAVWQPEEDELLAHWQAKVGNKWSVVAKHIPGRTGQQCAQRWRHKVNPDISHTPWTAEEDALLLSLVESHGQHWAAIARQLPGRTDQQCLGRWRRRLDPSVCRGEWTAEEDDLLLQLHSELGNSWSQIARRISARTSQQCRGRYFQLQSKNDRPSKRAAARPSKRGSGRKQGTSSEELDEYQAGEGDDDEELQPFRAVQAAYEGNTAWHDELAEADDEQDEPARRAASMANKKAVKHERASFKCFKQEFKQEPMPEGLVGMEGWVDMQQATTIQLPHMQSTSHLASTLQQAHTTALCGLLPVQPGHGSGVKAQGVVQQGTARRLTPSELSDRTLAVTGVLHKATPRQLLCGFEHDTDDQLDAEATAMRRAPATATARMRASSIRRPKCTPVMLRMMSARTPQGASPPAAARTQVPPLPLLRFGAPQASNGPGLSQACGDLAEAPSYTGRSRGTDHEGWTTDRDAPGVLHASCNMKRKSMDGPLSTTFHLDPLPPSCSTASLFTPRSTKPDTAAGLTSPPASNRSAARARTSYSNPMWSQEQGQPEEPLWTGGAGNHGTPDSIVRILQSPDVGPTTGLFSPMPRLSIQPSRSPRPRANSPVPMASLEPAHAEPMSAAYTETVQAEPLAGAECTPELKHEQVMPAAGVASGAASPHGPCVSNWSTVPALSWTSFQQAREMHRNQQGTINNEAHCEEPTPISNHTQSLHARRDASSRDAFDAGLPRKHLQLHSSFDDQQQGSGYSSPVAPVNKPCNWPAVSTNGSVQKALPSAPGTDGVVSTAGGSSLRGNDLADLSGDENAPPTVGSAPGSAGHPLHQGSSQGSKGATPLGTRTSQPLVWGNPTILGTNNTALGCQTGVKPSTSVAGLAWPKPLKAASHTPSMTQTLAGAVVDASTSIPAASNVHVPSSECINRIRLANSVKTWLGVEPAAGVLSASKKGTNTVSTSEKPPASTNFAAGPGAHISKLKASPSKKLRVEERSSSPFVASQADAAKQPSSPSQPPASKHQAPKPTSPLHVRSFSAGETAGAPMAQQRLPRGAPAAGMSAAGCSHSDDERGGACMPQSLLPRRAMPGYPGFGPARPAQCQSLLAGFKPQPNGNSQPNLAELASASACASPVATAHRPQAQPRPVSDSNLAARARMLRTVWSEPTDAPLSCRDCGVPEAQGSAVKPGLQAVQHTPQARPENHLQHTASGVPTHQSRDNTQSRMLPGMVPVPMQGFHQQQAAEAAAFLSPAARSQPPAMRVPCLPNSLPSLPLRLDPPAAYILSLATQRSLQQQPAPHTVFGWPKGPIACATPARMQPDQLSVAGCQQQPAPTPSTAVSCVLATPSSNPSAAAVMACGSSQKQPTHTCPTNTNVSMSARKVLPTQSNCPAQLQPVPVLRPDDGKQDNLVLEESTPFHRAPASAGSADDALAGDMMDLGSSHGGNNSSEFARLAAQPAGTQQPVTDIIDFVDGEGLQPGQFMDGDYPMRPLGDSMALAGKSFDMLHRGTTMSTDLDFFALGPALGPS